MPHSDASKGGSPAFDRVLMLKLLLLQAIRGLADEYRLTHEGRSRISEKQRRSLLLARQLRGPEVSDAEQVGRRKRRILNH
jgi:hypothetical protein